jgi:YHS domain-containing protein
VCALSLPVACSAALASVEFTGRLALSGDSAGQSFLQVSYDESASRFNLRSVSDSETNLNVLLDTDWLFSRDGGHRFTLENRLRYGFSLARDRLDACYGYDSGSGSRFEFRSESEAERGKIFERDETDLRQAFVGRWSRRTGDGRDRFQIYGRAEVRRVKGDSLFFPQSYNMGVAKVNWTRDLGLLSTIDVGYGLRSTAVVDSAPGSYVEHEVTALYDAYEGSSYYFSTEASAARRDYIHADNSSATGWSILSKGVARYSPSLSLDLEARPSFELVRHDAPDFVYYDYRKVGLDLGVKVRSGDGIGWELLPGGEFLRAPGLEREDYDQGHASLGFDVMSNGFWLDVSCKIGRRDYASPAPRDDLESVPRSDYVFTDLLLLAETRVWGPIALRVTGSHDVEWHELEEDNVTVFLVSSEISYRF